MKVLIAGDESLTGEILQTFFAGYAEIVTACDGQDAVRTFTDGLQEKRPFDLVLLDIVMPVMDGRLSLRLMRSLETKLHAGQEKKTVIIVTSDLQSPQDMQQLFWEEDCTDFLLKPVFRDDLMAMLKRYGLAAPE